MALQFILGDITQNKKQKIIQKIYLLSKKHPQSRFFYIVPEHLKFDMEELMLTTLQDLQGLDSSSLFNIQVLSFKRLAWFLLPNNIKNKQSLSDMGIKMLIQQILIEESDHLVLYKGQVHHAGFVEKLADLFNELINGAITADNLQEIVMNFENSPQISEEIVENLKLKELTHLYLQFCKKMDQMNIFNYQDLDLLKDFLHSNSNFQNDYIIIDHHYFFNAKELALLIEMMKQFNTVWLTLPMSHTDLKRNHWQPLYELPKNTYKQLLNLCDYYQLNVLANWDITNCLYEYHPKQSDLLNTLKLSLNQEKYISNRTSTRNHELWINDSYQTELLHISNQINDLVVNKGIRYRDILIMGRDISKYEEIVEPYFSMNQIPYFFDNKQEMKNHHFVHWLNSLFMIHRYHWKIEDIIGFLKSRFIKPNFIDSWEEYFHRVSILENIIIENGFTGYRFYQNSYDWIYETSDNTYIDHLGQETDIPIDEIVQELRQWMINTLVPLYKAYTSKMTGEGASYWLFNSLNELNIMETLQSHRNNSIQTGNLDDSRKIEQVWNTLKNIIEEFHLINQSQFISFQDFTDIVMMGISQTQFHIIPPTIDQVTFTSVDSPQVKPYKVVFIINADDMHLPQYKINDSLLTDHNRDFLREHLLMHQTIHHFSNQQNLLEILTAYQAFTLATEQIYISIVNNGEEDTHVSSFYQPLFLNYEIPIKHFTREQALNFDHPSHFGKIDSLILPIVQNIRKYHSVKPVTKFIHYYKSHASQTQTVQLLTLLKRTFTPISLPTNIDKNVATDLFGKNLNVSVSSIEKYYKDPFAHFLIKGLKLQERRNLEILPTLSGNYHHDILDHFFETLIQNDISLENISNEELHAIFSKVRIDVLENNTYHIFNNNSRFEIQRNLLDFSIYRYLFLLREQAQFGILKPEITESVFGFKHADLNKTLIYPLETGGKLILTGKIDRIDFNDPHDKFQVIDYKSGSKKFNAKDIIYGHELQLLTYLSIIKKNFNEAQPIGAFYHQITQEYQDGQEFEWQNGNESKIAINKMRYSGFITAPAEEMRALNSNVDQLYPLDFIKSGNYKATTKYYDQTSLNLLLQYVKYLYIQAGNHIQSGNIELAPYFDDKYSTSLDSKYRVITGFDATEHYNRYRFKTINEKSMLSEIQAILDEKGEIYND